MIPARPWEFFDWKHAGIRFADREKSEERHQSVLSLGRRSVEIGKVYHELTLQVRQIEQYWQSVLKRLIKMMTFLCQRGLAITDDDEIIGSVRSRNHRDMFGLLAEYDNFLKQHIQKHASCESGHTSYLSSTTSEELDQLMGKTVVDEIISHLNTIIQSLSALLQTRATLIC